MASENGNLAWCLCVAPGGIDGAGVWLEKTSQKTNKSIQKLLRAGPIEAPIGEIAYKAKGGKKKKIVDYHVLPTSVAVPIVSDELRQELSSFVGDEVNFFPATIEISKTETISRWALHPNFVKPCVDFSKSKIRKWLIPNKYISFYDSIVFIPNCLGDHKIIRNLNLMSQVVVSGDVKKIFEKYQTPNFRFLRDFELTEDNI